MGIFKKKYNVEAEDILLEIPELFNDMYKRMNDLEELICDKIAEQNVMLVLIKDMFEEKKKLEKYSEYLNENGLFGRKREMSGNGKR